MVNEHNEKSDVERFITNDEEEVTISEEVTDDETNHTNQRKKYQARIAELETQNKLLLEEMQRAKADFLNAKRRLEEERLRDRERARIEYVTSLLPVCDSFQMAFVDAAWQTADSAWKKGIEAIYGQLLQVLKQHNVLSIDPVGQPFDHHRHEAIGTEVVSDPTLQDTITTVIQNGYEIQSGEERHLIRPARVTTGVLVEDTN